MTTAPPPFDVDAVMVEIRAEVERRKEAGDYDEALLQAVHEEFSFDPAEPPEATAYIAAVRPLVSTRPVIGPVIVFAKRVIRRLIAWYVAPIAEDQTRHNVSSIHLMRSLERRVTAIDHALSPVGPRSRAAAAAEAPAGDHPSIDELVLRVRDLEQQVASLTAPTVAGGAAAQPASNSESE